MRRRALIGALAFAGLAAAGERPSLSQLYGEHRWIDLREALKDQAPPALYKGAVAFAFNDTKAAEEYLNQAIKLAPNSNDAKDAHAILAKIDVRAGRYHETVQQLDEMLRLKPGSSDVENTRAIFAAWNEHGDQSIESSRPSEIRADVRKDGVKLPVSIHGKTVHWLLDTGFNFSLMSESEARSLGVAIDKSSGSLADSAGGTTSTRTAVADELTIGDVHLRNVAFLILPDAQEPMSDWQPGERGVIGLPAIIALQSFSWTSDGRFKIGSKSVLSSSAPIESRII
jgi:tetratricopeptide (TPR) repeat protein